MDRPKCRDNAYLLYSLNSSNIRQGGLVTELQNLFQALGFLSHPTDFNHAVPYAELRTDLEGKFRESNVSKILRHFPDLFVVNEKIEKGIFFIKDVSKDALSSEAAEAYKKYYPKDVLLVKVSANSKGKALLCRWIGDAKDRGLLDALESRFGTKPPSSAVSELATKGWLL